MTNNDTRRKITFEKETCTRCGGTGRYPSACYNGVCLGCTGTGKKLTRRGAAALKAYNAVMDEMKKPASEVKVGDLVKITLNMSGAQGWRRVDAIVEDSGVRIGDRKLPGLVFMADSNMPYRVSFNENSTFEVWDEAVRERAIDRVARLKGAIIVAPEGDVTNDEKVAQEGTQGPARRGSHADCDHEATPKARAACRKARKA